jgi:hypothetical protein
MMRLTSFCFLLALTVRAAAAEAPAPSWPSIVEADWLVQESKRATANPSVTPEEDAAGAVDGVKNGRWGFHTAEENDPWWQVDLEKSVKLQRVVIWNRCEEGISPRNFHIRLLVSQDGKTFEPIHQHDGTPFMGFSDGHPLTVDLPSPPARYLRLALTGKQFFHLDEVEVFADGSNENIARAKPCTQSSVSAWSVAHAGTAAFAAQPLAPLIERGMKLAASQRRLGVDTTAAERVLADARQRAAAGGLPPGARHELYLTIRRTIRKMALANPLLNFDAILFVKRAPGMFPHMSDQHYGWWSRPGGGVCVLENFKEDRGPRVRCLTADLPPGSVMGPELSFDARKILFAYCKFHPELADEPNKADKKNVPEEAFYHIYEMNADGTGRRRLTHGKYDDFDARYLPNGEIAFVSTRKGTAIQCSHVYSESTRHTDWPDSYVRCGGDNYRPVPVFTLHAMQADGSRLRPLSAFENFEWTPSVAHDGRLLYTRWDYIDRFNGDFFSLWSANQDGGNPQLVYGNYTVKPQVVIEARAIPASSKIVFVATAHHSIYGGSLCLLDRTRGTEYESPLTRLTPDVPFPETEANVDQYYANPWPLSEEYFLVSWSNRKLPPHHRATNEDNPANATGLYLLDAFGNLELLYRDPEISSASPVPMRPRPRPPVQPELANLDGPQEGRLLMQDVTKGLEAYPPGTIKELRVVAVPPKVQPFMNQPSLGVSAEEPGKYVLGTVPVEADGSAHFRVPSGVPVFFQALDAQGVALQTMRSLTYVMPGQTLSCIGCHEDRNSAAPIGTVTIAAGREPSRITPEPSGSWPLRFDQLVQPVLDRHCVACHHPGAEDPAAARLDLTPAKAYDSLLGFADGDLKRHAFERDRSVPGEGTASQSRLWQMLSAEKPHADVVLDTTSRRRLLTWLDTYAPRIGHFSPEQENQLKAFRRECAPLLHEHEAQSP